MRLANNSAYDMMCGSNNGFGNLINMIEKEIDKVDRKFTPLVNISEDDGSYYITAEMAGLGKEDINISVKDNVLEIKGTKSSVTEESDEKNDIKTVKSEILDGEFKRTFTLPDDVIQEDISAEMKNGLLRLILAKKEPEKPKEIKVSIH